MKHSVLFIKSHSNKAILNNKILEKIAPLMDFLEMPLTFSIKNCKNNKISYIGIVDFSEENNIVKIPEHIGKSINLEENDKVEIEIIDAELINYVKMEIIREKIDMNIDPQIISEIIKRDYTIISQNMIISIK